MRILTSSSQETMRRRGLAWLVPSLAVLAALLLTLTRASAAGTLPAPGEYVIDPAGSTVAFNITNFLVASVDGKFGVFSGHVTVGDALATTHIDATVDVKSIDTGIAMRDGHLREADFFDAARFPTMTFTSTAVWGTPDNLGIKGNLTIKGVTKEVVWSGRILDSGAVRAETKIDRTDFGITAAGASKNEVRLRLLIKLAKPS